MQCCEVVKLINKKKHYKTLHNKYNNTSKKQNGCTPYVMANVMMATYTTCNIGKLVCLCNKCHSNQKKTSECNTCSVPSTIMHGHIAFYTPNPCAIIIFSQYYIKDAIAKFKFHHRLNNRN